MNGSHDAWLVGETTPSEEHVKRLLAQIDAFIARRGWSEGYFSKRAAGDVGVTPRLRQSGRVTAKKLAQIERFLSEESGLASGD